MKFAPILAGGTLGLVLLTLATAKAISPPQKTLALDVRGIDTVVVRHLAAEVVIHSTRPAQVQYADRADWGVSVRREGTRLYFDRVTRADGPDVKIVVPAGVHHFIGVGNVQSDEALAQVEVEERGTITWSGDVERLVLRDTSDPKRHRDDAAKSAKPGHCDCDYGSDLRVTKGKIGELKAYSPHAELHLDQPDSIGVVYAWLGPKGTVSLDNATRFEHIHLDQVIPGEASAPAPR
jgi:hypothetical protein